MSSFHLLNGGRFTTTTTTTTAAEEAERLFQTQACWGSIIHKIYVLGPKL